MTLINIVLDTNIYRNNPSRDNLHFKALEKLSTAGLLCIHIPYVVLREFQTQQREIYSKDLAKALSGLSGLSRKLFDKEVLDKLNATRIALEQDSGSILSNAENQITTWAGNIGAKVYPLCIDQANLALEAYFQGSPPLKSIKNREDIPDSFIVQSINKLASEFNQIHVVAGDGKVRDAFSKQDEIKTYESLSDFIETGDVQNELKEVDLIVNIDQIVEAIQQFESDNSEIQYSLSRDVGEAIVWKTFSDPSIRDDNHEATISSYGEAEDIELDLSNVGYYGNGQFGIPFKLKIIVMADYCIFKSDYYGIDHETENVPSVTDLNDHYFDAQEEFELYVSGLVSITVDRENINMSDILESIVEDSIEIGEITSIELC